MENMEEENAPKGKTLYDFVLLFLVLGGLVAVLMFIKYAIGALHLV